MKTFEKTMTVITLIVLIIGVVGSFFGSDYFAALGWLSGVVMCALLLEQDSNLQDWEDLFHETQYENSKLQRENKELRAQIRELELFEWEMPKDEK